MFLHKPKIRFFLCFMLSGFSSVTAANTPTQVSKEKELRYQEVFYHFYRKDAFNALVNFSAGLYENNLPKNLNQNQLLLGSLYFMYDLDKLAESTFLNVIQSRVAPEQKSVAWYFLAKIYYKADNFRQLSEALIKTKQNLPASLQDERAYILGMYYLKIRDLVNAKAVLKTIDEDTFWYQMFQFNLGASYIKANLGVEGAKFIRNVGDSKQSNDNMLALKDKSNIVLGYYFLRNNKSPDAIEVLENVRLSGPFSNKALLGLGWAYTEKQQFRKALIPWMALSEKDPNQLTVQEALLAVPYAFMQLKAEDKSLELYKNSIDIYESVKTEIDLALSVAKKSSFFNVLLVDRSYDDFTISRKIIEHKDSVQGRVLSDLLQDEEFQQMFNTYRDLKQLESKLIEWRGQLSKMKIMLRATPEDTNFEDSTKLLNRPLKDKRYYVETVLTLTDRVKLQEDRLTILLGKYESFVQEHVLKALNKKRQYIVTYLSQTRFAMAELLDKAQKLE